MKRDLFVFCGQSNMMGASVLPPKHNLKIKNSLEFKYRDKHIGIGDSYFKKVGYDSGEFLYVDINTAYPDKTKKSRLTHYHPNCYFIPSVAQEGTEFTDVSEANYNFGASVVPYFCECYEALGNQPLVTHIAKGSTKISHYFNREMEAEYNSKIPPEFEKLKLTPLQYGANEVFTKKTLDMFALAEKNFGSENIGKKIFLWLQGESDAKDSEAEYRLKLEILWKYAKYLGFDYFFCIRVGYWNNPNIINVINAQESFCKENPDCFMVSRTVSFMPNCVMLPPADWYKKQPDQKYIGCRDTYNEEVKHYQNSHINEKGFLIVGRELAENAHRILVQNKNPVFDEELLKGVK